MFASNRACVLAVLLTAACAQNPAPRGALPDDRGALHDGYGAFVVAERITGAALEGELIAASADTLWVLHENGLGALPRVSLRQAIVSVHETRGAGYAAWFTLGTILTASNGVYLLLTAPMWLIAGGVALGIHSRQPLHKWDAGQPLESVAPYARYPGGIPDGFDRSRLVLPERMRLR
ncbi:MAG TPA: hypothetical protein VF021_06615 [Longimicrobiales bacterium]